MIKDTWGLSEREEDRVDASQGCWTVTDRTVVLTDHPSPHTLTVKDMATGEAGDSPRPRQVLLTDLTDRI